MERGDGAIRVLTAPDTTDLATTTGEAQAETTCMLLWIGAVEVGLKHRVPELGDRQASIVVPCTRMFLWQGLADRFTETARGHPMGCEPSCADVEGHRTDTTGER